jgi:hypothetical protein
MVYGVPVTVPLLFSYDCMPYTVRHTALDILRSFGWDDHQLVTSLPPVSIPLVPILSNEIILDHFRCFYTIENCQGSA